MRKLKEIEPKNLMGESQLLIRAIGPTQVYLERDGLSRRLLGACRVLGA